MKIGIVTFNSAHNYGAVLQAWSLQTYLEKQGHDVDIVNLRPWVIDDVYAMAKKKRLVENEYVNTALNKLRIAKNCVTQPVKLKRRRNFERFINTKLNVTKVYRSGAEIRADKRLKYDVLIAGSDQIWNSGITKKIDSAYFLDFGKPDTKRISYAASIGGKELQEIEYELFRNFLQKIDYISVREINAKRCLEPLTDKNIEIVADPTFLLKQKDFDKLKKSYHVKKPYIYVHNVHLVREDVELNEVARELSRRTGLPIVSNRKEKFFENEAGKFLTGTPEEFIGVIADAEYVVTNSFHATVFSIIYHRNFITIPHYNNPDRMQNLLKELGVSNHLMNAAEMIPEDLSDLAIDYEDVELKKEKMSKHSRHFLKRAIDGPKHGAYMEYAGVCVTDTEQFQEKDFADRSMELISAKNKHVYEADTWKDVMLPLAKNVTEKGGKIALPVYQGNKGLHYTLTDDVEVIRQAVLPEHFEADLAGIYEAVKQQLENGTEVLFAGNACRLAALRKYLGKEYEKLILVETLCHGIGKKEIFQKYVAYLENLYKSKLAKIELRNKFRKPAENFVVYTFESGAVKVENAEREDLSYAIHSGYIQEFPCYACMLRGGENGCSDLVLAMPEDFERIEEQPAAASFMETKESGVLRIESDKGQRLWNEVLAEYDTVEVDADEIWQKRVEMSYTRNAIMKALEEGADIGELLLEKNWLKKKKRNI